MRRLITLSLLALLIGLTGYQASASNERTGSANVPRVGDQLGVSTYPTGTWNSGIQVQNPTTSSATVQIRFYDSAGLQIYITTAATVAAGGSQTYYLPDDAFASLPNGKYSGVVESDQAVVAVVNETNYTNKGLADSYNGISTGSTSLNLPLVYRARNSTDSMIAVQNTDASTTANITMRFIGTPPSTVDWSKTDTIPILASKTYDISSSTFDSLGAPFLGSLSISSNTNVAAIAHSVKNTSDGELSIYRAFSTGATRFLAPLVYNQWTGATTSDALSGVQVQNLGGTADTITMVYTLAPALGGASYTSSQTVAANASTTFYMPTFPGVPAGNYGSAVISSGSNQIVVVVNNVKSATGIASAYNAFTDGSGSTRVVAPLVFNQYSPDWITGIQVMNVGSASDTVTMVFRPTNSVSGSVASYSKNLNVAAGSNNTFYLPNFPDIPAGLYGTAEITSTSQKIIAVINTTKYSANISTAYTGINE
ncbi:MAG: hypothetical protein Q7R39_10810 [Dehalococcoidia bacterium]|nr:hypothetical protein [Dehalococcoidia bacterium]